MRKRYWAVAYCVVAVTSLWASTARALIDPDAAIVYLRTDCAGLDDCFESTIALSGDDAAGGGWIWDTRQPSASDPLLVDVGPGTFEPFHCPNGASSPNGYVTVRGSGREQSVLEGSLEGAHLVNCTHVSFERIGLHGGKYGVLWNEGGDATWTDVDMVATAGSSGGNVMGWADICNDPTARSLHYVFGSRARSLDPRSNQIGVGYFTSCAENWFYGGDIELLLSTAGASSLQASAVRVTRTGDLRVFGSTVRATMDAYRSGKPLEAVVVEDEMASGGTNAVFHMHGGIINASVNADPGAGDPVDAVALTVGRGGFAHTPGTAFVTKPSAGGTPVRTRLTDDYAGHFYPPYVNPNPTLGKILAPFHWPSGNHPPGSGSETSTLLSLDGQDAFVETDCAENGDCDGNGPGDHLQAHLMIYNPAACGTAVWLDVVTGRCRNDTGP